MPSPSEHAEQARFDRRVSEREELRRLRAENEDLRARLATIALNARGQVDHPPPGRHPSDTWLWQSVLTYAEVTAALPSTP